MSIGRCFARHQRHAAFGAVSGGVADDFGVHRASVFHAHLKSGGVKLPAVSAKRARGDHAAQIGQPGSQPGPCQRGRHVRIGQRGDVAGTQRKDRAGARDLRVGDGGGIAQTGRIVEGSLSGLWHMITGAISTCNISGPIGIAETSGAMASQGAQSFIWFIAVLSTAVGLLNLFPIPALDGGHLVFYMYEAVAGRPPNEKALRILMSIGIAAILTLMLFALGNDLFC